MPTFGRNLKGEFLRSQIVGARGVLGVEICSSRKFYHDFPIPLRAKFASDLPLFRRIGGIKCFKAIWFTTKNFQMTRLWRTVAKWCEMDTFWGGGEVDIAEFMSMLF